MQILVFPKLQLITKSNNKHFPNWFRRLSQLPNPNHHPNIPPTCPKVPYFAETGFLEVPTLRLGETLHAIFIKSLIRRSVFVSNTLLFMYFRFGQLGCALKVFDEMPSRNAASWNTVVSGLVKAGLYEKAARLVCRMRMEDVGLNCFVMASVLTGCDRSGWMVGEGAQYHGLVWKAGLGADVYVGTSLVHFYGSYGFVEEAMRCFDDMPERNVVSWTALMVGCSNNGCPDEAIRAYQKMRREGVVCNSNSFTTVVSSCGLIENEPLALQVVGHVVLSGYASDVSVGNSLVTLFGCLDKVDFAEFIFQNMERRDAISWNSMISVYSHIDGMCYESLSCFSKMRHFGEKPDSSTLCTLISACNCIDHLGWGRGLHASVVTYGLLSSVSVCNTLINMYTMCAAYADANRLFHEIPEKDLISWNSMISSYVQRGQNTDALRLLPQLLRTNLGSSHVTFTSVLAACCNPEALLDGKAVHAIMIRSRIQQNLMSGNALITMYCNCSATNDAHRIFQTLPIPDVVSWNALIGGQVDNELPNEAMKTFNKMRGSRTNANYITMVNILGACCIASYLKFGLPLHAHMISSGFDFDGFVKNSILAMYGRCGDFKSTTLLFDTLPLKSSVSWNAMISAKAHHGQGEEALKMLKDMLLSGLELDQFSLCGGLAGCASLASLEEGQQLHSLTIKLGFDSDLQVINTAMDMYAKCGRMDLLLKMLPNIGTRTRQTWNVLISGYARHGCFQKAKETFSDMLRVGPKPDYVTFVSLLSACNHRGLVSEGLDYFRLMTSELKISPTAEHCVCIVDLLGRSGRLDEAEKFIEDMLVSPNDIIWRSLLASSRIHGNLKVGKKAAERLLELDPFDDSAYVLLSNVCATNSRWQEVEQVRTHMKTIQLKKKHACSWIKLKHNVYKFGIGDTTHPESKQIHAKLKEILQMVKDVGYVADTTFSLHDTDDEQKEQNLWNHSEKLALAFGLMSLPEGSSITVFKNIRVCGDCHLVYKLVSDIFQREIVLRDPFRFHHFNRGQCSCLDYW